MKTKVNSKDAPLKVELKDAKLIISIGIETLAYAFEHSDYAAEELKVKNPKMFAKEVISSLQDEEEDGTTAVHIMLDAACQNACENGAMGVEQIEEDSE